MVSGKREAATWGCDGERAERLRYDLTNALQPVRRAWLQVATQTISGCGLSVSLSTPILFVSRLGDGVQQRVLADEIGVHPAALVRSLTQGERAGLLERRSVPGDRRARGVYLLPEGRRLAALMEAELASMRDSLIGEIPTADIEIAIRVLRQLETSAHGWLGRQAENGIKAGPFKTPQ